MNLFRKLKQKYKIHVQLQALHTEVILQDSPI